MTLLSIVHNQAKTIQLGLQQAAALYFKNLVKEGWERVRSCVVLRSRRTTSVWHLTLCIVSLRFVFLHAG